MTEKILEKLQDRFNLMMSTCRLYRSSVSGDCLWEEYMKGFGKDPIFRDPSSSVHNCNNCKNFVRRYAGIVALDKNLDIITMFDGNDWGSEYQQSFTNLSNILKSSDIRDVFFETYDSLKSLPYERCTKTQKDYRLGVEKNVKVYTTEEANKFGVVKPGQSILFYHLSCRIDSAFVDKSGKSIEALQGAERDKYSVFKRAMEEIPIDTLYLVRDLIAQGSLLDGDAHLPKLEEIIKKKVVYDKLPADKRDVWCWDESDFKYAKFKNELIGVLCSDLAQGVELNKACKDWNYRVDPVNYMKATAPITKKQIEEAKKFVEDNGYEESFSRRCATIEDIKACDILHLNGGDGVVKPISVFDGVKPTCTRHKKSEFDKVEKVTIDRFMKDILPTCTSVEVFLQNQHKRNLVTLTTSQNTGGKGIFKWGNNFSWTYNGNLAGKSQIKEAVKTAGGFVDAPFRFSIVWNEDWQKSPVSTDLDAHAIEPGGREIYFGNYKKPNKTSLGGQLDIDMISPRETGVENIYWLDMKKVIDGAYRFFIRRFSGTACTARAEIYINGQTYQYNITDKITSDTEIATVFIKGGEVGHINHNMKYLTSGEDVDDNIYGLDTNEFHKVNLVCLSPNYWQETGTGNKHYFFMMDKCKCPMKKLRSFHNENLNSDLLAHRKVMEVLADQTQVESTDKQLSGLGFDATVRDEVILRLGGSHKRVIKVEF